RRSRTRTRRRKSSCTPTRRTASTPTIGRVIARKKPRTAGNDCSTGSRNTAWRRILAACGFARLEAISEPSTLTRSASEDRPRLRFGLVLQQPLSRKRLYLHRRPTIVRYFLAACVIVVSSLTATVRADDAEDLKDTVWKPTEGKNAGTPFP